MDDATEDLYNILTEINDDVSQNVILAILISWAEGQIIIIIIIIIDNN